MGDVDEVGKVLTFINTPSFGGPHNQVLRLKEALGRKGWTIEAALPFGASGEKRLRDSGVPLVEFAPPRLRATRRLTPHVELLTGSRAAFGRAREIIRSSGPDVVQVCGLTTLFPGLAAWREGVPVVWQLLGTYAPSVVRAGLSPIVTRIAGCVMTAGVQPGTKHLGVRGMKERWIPFYPPVDQESIRRVRVERERLRDRLGVRNDEVLVVAVGNLYRAKGFEVLIQAIQRLYDEGFRLSGARVAIVGEETPSTSGYADLLRQKLSGLEEPLAGRITLIDPLGSALAFLAAADVFCLSSLSEGAPTVLLEALAAGLPAVVTEVGAVPEIVGRDYPLMVPPGDAESLCGALQRLLSMPPPAREAIGAELSSRFERHFSLEECARTHVRAYEAALQGRT